MKIIISIEKTLNVHLSLPKGLNAKRITAHNTAVGCVKSISSLSNRLDGKNKNFELETSNLSVIISYLRATNENDTDKFIDHIAAALGVKVIETQIHKELKGKSAYKDLIVDFTRSQTLRTSNHNVNIERFRSNTREKICISIVVDDIPYLCKQGSAVEYVYYESRMNCDRYIEITEAIKHLLVNDKWNENIAPYDVRRTFNNGNITSETWEEAHKRNELKGLQGTPDENDPYYWTKIFNLQPAVNSTKKELLSKP